MKRKHFESETQAQASKEIQFMFACFENNIELVKKLLQDKNLNVNQILIIKRPSEIFAIRSTGLIEACRNGNINIVKLLLNDKRIHDYQKVNIEFTYLTALSEASDQGQAHIVRLFLHHLSCDSPESQLSQLSHIFGIIKKLLEGISFSTDAQKFLPTIFVFFIHQLKYYPTYSLELIKQHFVDFKPYYFFNKSSINALFLAYLLLVTKKQQIDNINHSLSDAEKKNIYFDLLVEAIFEHELYDKNFEFSKLKSFFNTRFDSDAYEVFLSTLDQLQKEYITYHEFHITQSKNFLNDFFATSVDKPAEKFTQLRQFFFQEAPLELRKKIAGMLFKVPEPMINTIEIEEKCLEVNKIKL